MTIYKKLGDLKLYLNHLFQFKENYAKFLVYTMEKGGVKDLRQAESATKISASSLSRYKRYLLEKGYFYIMNSFEGNELTEEVLPCHPFCLIAQIEVESPSFDRKRFKDEIDMLEKAWEKGCGKSWKDKKWIAFATGWIEDFAYGNLLGWLVAIKDYIKDGEVKLFTPHLKLLGEGWRHAVERLAEECDLNFTFICESSSAKDVQHDGIEIIKGAEKFPLYEIDRYGIAMNSEGEPLFGFRAQKIETLKKYTGILILRHEKELKVLKDGFEELVKFAEI